jgi:hypothetical protein
MNRVPAFVFLLLVSFSTLTVMAQSGPPDMTFGAVSPEMFAPTGIFRG